MATGSGQPADFTAQHLDEYQLKAAFLYNFAKFVDWPVEAFRGPSEPFSICVLGDDPFGQSLDDMVASKTVGGRPIAVRRISDSSQTDACHILFVSSPPSKRALSILAAAKRTGVLTVGDAGVSTAEGIAIGFVMASGKVRFEIDPAVAGRAGLHISSKLMSLAQIGRR
jgi:hypothetical protein